jgi:hypothetical protein
MKVTYHVFKDFKVEQTGSSDEQILARAKNRRKIERLRYSFVAMRWHPRTRKIFLGSTNGAGDLLVEFDVDKRKFRSCGYGKSGLWHYCEHKIHKGIWLDKKEDALYFGTSTLRGIPDTIKSPGGTLARYDIKKRTFRRVANPTPGDFYQATCYDPKRKKLYMYTMPGSCFAVYDMRKKKLLRHEPVESIPHIGCIDDEGAVWGTYGIGRQAFFRYHPDKDDFEFPPDCRFPNAHEAANVMYTGAGPVDGFINGGDGYLYAASALGEIYRIDPVSKEVKYLGKPFAGKRLPGIFLADDGWLYLCGGSDKSPMLARYDRDSGQFEFLGPVTAKDGLSCYRCHEMVVIDNTAYIGETDNPTRSGYIWTCEF